jgi:hypothetical protein
VPQPTTLLREEVRNISFFNIKVGIIGVQFGEQDWESIE